MCLCHLPIQLSEFPPQAAQTSISKLPSNRKLLFLDSLRSFFTREDKPSSSLVQYPDCERGLRYFGTDCCVYVVRLAAHADCVANGMLLEGNEWV